MGLEMTNMEATPYSKEHEFCQETQQRATEKLLNSMT
jgi:hypothetical protein